jgi:AraC-like DNA-binding protein
MRAMARRPKPPPAPSRILPPLLRWVRARGGDVDALVRRFGLPADVERVEAPMFEAERMDELFSAIADELGDPFLGLHLPEALEWRRYTMAELAARASPTVRAALERVVRFGATFYAHLEFALEDRDGEVVFSHRLRGTRQGGAHSNEYALASSLTHLRRSIGERVSPRRVWFIHRRAGDVSELERFFGTRAIAFGRSENALAFDAALMARPLATGDARLLATTEELAARSAREQPAPSDFAAQVAARVTAALESGPPKVEVIARQLRMSPRTLARRLDGEGTSYRAVVESVRRELACRYAEDAALSLADVAYRVGFSDVATFSRAFKRWTGRTPGSYRRG